MKRRTVPQITKDHRLSWINRGALREAYPYRIVDCVRGWEVWVYGPQGLEKLAIELASLRLAKEFCERHSQRERETA